MANFKVLIDFIRRGVGKAAQGFRTLGQSAQNMRRDTTKISGGVNQLHKQIAATTFQNWGRQMTGVAKQGIDAYTGFEEQMGNVGAVLGKGGKDLEGYKKDVRSMAKSTIFNAQEVSSAYYTIASAGESGKENIKGLADTSMKLATAAGTDAKQATETLLSTINAFGMDTKDANEVANIFMGTVKNSFATMPKLANSLRYTAASASSLGYDVADLTGTLGTMYSGGFKASQVGTMLRQAFTRMAKPTAEAKDLMNDLNLSFTDASGEFKSMPDIVSELQTKLEGMSGSQRKATLSTLFGTRAQEGMNYLVEQGAGALQDMRDDVSKTGQLQESYAIQSETAAAKMKIFQSKVMELKIAMGEALFPVLEPIVEILGKMMDAYEKLPGPIKELIPIVIGVGGAMMVAVGGILAFKVAMAATGGVMAGTMAPLMAAVVAGFLLYKAWKKWGDQVLLLVPPLYIIKKLFDAGVFHDFADAVKEIGEKFKDFVSAIQNSKIGTVLKYTAIALGLLLMPGGKLIILFYGLKKIVNWLTKAFHGSGLATAIEYTTKAMMPLLLYAKMIKAFFNIFIKVVHKLEKAFFGSGLASAVEYTMGIFEDFLDPVNVIKEAMEKLYDILKDTYDMMMKVKNTGEDALGGLGDIGKGFVSKIPGFQTGGMVDAPRGSPVPAIVHGGEMVLTPDQQKALLAGKSGGSDISIQVNGPITADDFFEELDRHLDERERNKLATR